MIHIRPSDPPPVNYNISISYVFPQSMYTFGYMKYPLAGLPSEHQVKLGEKLWKAGEGA
jgi:hypothetical protein